MPWVRHAVGRRRAFIKDERAVGGRPLQRALINAPIARELADRGFERRKMDRAFDRSKHKRVGQKDLSTDR